MRIALLIVLIITALSKKYVDIYKTENQIQKETLNNCILNSIELREDMKEIYGDIQKAFINHHYLDILKKLVDYNPRNNKIIFQCYETFLEKEDDIVLEKGFSSHSNSRSSPSRPSPSRPSPSRPSPSRPSPSKPSPSKPSPSKPSPSKPSPSKPSPSKPSPSKPSPSKPSPSKPSPSKPSPSKQTTRIPKPTTRIPKPTTNIPKPTTRIPKPTTMITKLTTRIPKSTTRIPKPTTMVTKLTTRIPKSTTRIPKPTTVVPKHTSRIPKPTTVVPKPTTIAPKPTTRIPKPSTIVPKPTTIVPKPTTRIPKQTTVVPKHTSRIPKPTTRIPKPTTVVPKPTSRIPKPTTVVPKPTSRIPKPTTVVPKPTTRIPKPTTVVPKPTTRIPKPTTVVPKPTTRIPKPTTVVPKPTTRIPKPTTVVPKPTTRINNPTIRLTKTTTTVSQPGKNDIKDKNKNPNKFNPLKWANNIFNPKVKIKNKNVEIEAKRDSLSANVKTGKDTEININTTPNSASLGGKHTFHKGLQDITYSGNLGVKSKDGQTDLTAKGGRMIKTNKGPAYTKQGHEFEATGTYINDGNRRGGGGSFTDRQIHGQGFNLGGADISNTNTRERTVHGQVTRDKSGRLEAKGGYTDKNINKRAINVAGNEVSRSVYNTKSYEGRGGIQKTPYGYKGDGSFTRKNIDGQTYQVGKASYTQEHETGNVIKGGGNIGRHGGNLHGSVENYDKTTHKFGYGNIKGEVSRKDYEKISANAGITSRNGVVTGRLGASYAQGTQYTGKLGNMQVTGGIEDKTSIKGGIKATKNGVTANAQFQDSQRVSGGVQIGKNLKVDGSAGRTETANARATINKNGVRVKANYETAYDAKVHAKIGKTDVNARAKFSDNIYGGASVQVKNGQVNVGAKVGKEYKVGAGLKINGKNVASVDASAKGEVNAKVKASKNGVSAQAGVNGQAGAKATFGQTEVKVSVKADFHIGVGFDFKTGLHFDVGGGIHVEAGVKDNKTGKQTNVKLFASQGKPAYILYRKRRISGKKNMKKAKKNKILGQICRPSRRRN